MRRDASPLFLFLLLWLPVSLVFGLRWCSLEEPRRFSSSDSLSDSEEQQFKLTSGGKIITARLRPEGEEEP